MPDPTPAEEHWTAKLPKKRMASGALFFDEAGRVLLVKPTYTAGWDYPGGVVEADETPYAAACREIEEELGLSKSLGRLLVVDWEPPSEEIPLEGLMTVFDGGELSEAEIGAIRVPENELHGFELCPPELVRDRMPAHLARRALAAIRARESGGTSYLENGYTVGADCSGP